MSTLTETLKAGAYIVSEAPGTRSRDSIVVKSGADLLAGTILGRITIGAQTVADAVGFAGNTSGVGTIDSLTGDAGAMAGDWKVIVIEPGTNAGTFEVFKPDGTLDTPGRGTIGVAYNGGINFTWADATDAVAGDGYTINVSYAAGSGKYVPHDASATDGSQNACAILFADAPAASADVDAVAHTRDMEFNKSEVIWKTGITDNDKNAGLAALAVLGIIGR